MEDAYNRRRQEPDLAQQSSCSLAFRPPTARCIRGREAGEEGRTRRWLLSRNWEQRDRFAHSPASYQCLNCDAGTGNPRAVLHLRGVPCLMCRHLSPPAAARHLLHCQVRQLAVVSVTTTSPPRAEQRAAVPGDSSSTATPLPQALPRRHQVTVDPSPASPHALISSLPPSPGAVTVVKCAVSPRSPSPQHQGLPSEDDAECLWLSGANRLEVKCSPTLAGGGAAGGEVARTSLGVHCGNSRFEKLAM
uniref:Uncharacterized protein n=1 Tax=Oryza punctata TaxID=4537 RepID=A0A0E0K4Y0_ORYPU